MIAIIVALVIWAAPSEASAQTLRNIKGTVVDATGGVLPGVVVAAMAADRRTLASTVTNSLGEFTLDGLPPGQVALFFHLDGFADAKASVPNGHERLVQRMEVSAFAETVTVRGDPPPPPRVLAAVPAHDPAAVCGPAKPEDVVPAFGVIKSRRTDATHGLFAAGDELLIEPGRLNLLKAGQNYVVRRRYPTTLTNRRNQVTMGEHSAGLLQIVDVDGERVTAAVVYACDEMMVGDYLAPFTSEPRREPEPEGLPSFDKAARLLFGDAGQMLGSTNRLVVMAHGTRHGVRTGQRVTIFRRSGAGDATPDILGEGVVLAVRRESATVRVERATDVIFLGDGGDWVAPHGK